MLVCYRFCSWFAVAVFCFVCGFVMFVVLMVCSLIALLRMCFGVCVCLLCGFVGCLWWVV